MLKLNVIRLCLCGLLFLSPGVSSFAQNGNMEASIKPIDREVNKQMHDGHIPGLSLVIVTRNGSIIRNYGYADATAKLPVTEKTLFQLGSCSKAFTALAVVKLVSAGLISTDDTVSHFLPWFKPVYKDSVQAITIGQLLHHSSGIPWQTIALIPESNQPDALEQNVKQLADIKLRHLPGKNYEYATMNYDILALVIEKVTGQTFESYLTANILHPLGLWSTTIGVPADSSRMAKGYKMGFFGANEYNAPVYKGNNAAGYVISDATDMSKWLAIQAGITNTPLSGIITATHQRDEQVAIHNMSAYAMGWQVAMDGTGNIYHEGLNPNFTSYININAGRASGVAVLANANSSYTTLIGENIAKILANELPLNDAAQVDTTDSTFSVLAYLVAAYIVMVMLFAGKIIYDYIQKRRAFRAMTGAVFAKFLFSLVCIIPFLAGIYLLPRAMAGFNWKAAVVWMPLSFPVLIQLTVGAICLSYIVFLMSLIFPAKDTLKSQLPQIILMSIISGVANMLVIVLITSSIGSDTQWKYLLFYYALTCALYIFGRRFVQASLIKITRTVVCELQIRIIEKLFSTSYQNFEKIDKGKIYTVLNDNVNTIGESTNMLVMLITSTFTAIGAFAYLATIAFWATVLTILLVVTVTFLYYMVSRRTNKFYEEAWNMRNLFMNYINGLVDGFKEISLHRNKKLEYKSDVDKTVSRFKDSMTEANVKFINASMVGESLLVVLLGTVVFAIPKLFPAVYPHTVMSFVIILLYLMKPINELLGSVPVIMQLRIAWKRIQDFLKAIPANLDLNDIPEPLEPEVKSIRARGVQFRHKNKTDRDAFEIGPIDLEAKRGEIIFIIGANGSGKTTLAKLITGLYAPDAGEMLINNKLVTDARLSEYFSTVFSPSYLFQKLYNINIELKSGEANRYLKILDLEDKVEISENKYSTIELSGGQRKRLALLQCFLEDSPIYLFDEWAADQDPAYRSFFYRVLLPDMQKMGKIVIAITHDDHYFDVATRIFKMKNGKLEEYVNMPSTEEMMGTLA